MSAQPVPASPQPSPKDLPALDKLLRNTAVAALVTEHGHSCVAGEARSLLDALRQRALAGSLEPRELKTMVDGIRNIERALGDGIKRPSVSELKNKPIARKSLVAIRSIRAGETFSADNMGAKRPGTGLSPMHWDEVIGRTATKDFTVDELITL